MEQWEINYIYLLLEENHIFLSDEEIIDLWEGYSNYCGYTYIISLPEDDNELIEILIYMLYEQTDYFN